MTVLTLHRKEMPRLRRGGFLLLSLAIHLGLLAAWQGETQLQLGQSDSRYTSKALRAVLTPLPDEAREDAPEPVANKPQRKEQRAQKQALRSAATQTQTPTQESSEMARRATQTEAVAREQRTEVQRAAVEKRALGKIRIELARHFHYPRQAVRLGWQGEVLLRFRLTTSGRIEAVRVARSSGYSVLDSAAVRALNDVREIGRVMEHPDGNLDLQLPVIYRLQEG